MPTQREFVIQIGPSNGSAKYWDFQITQGEKRLCDSSYFAVRLKSQAAAQWLAYVVSNALQQADLPILHDESWTGDLNDDCHFDDGDFQAHVEWLSGPRRGGTWYCEVNGGANHVRYFHTADFSDIVPKSGLGARKLCTLLIHSARLGLLKPAVV